MICRDFSGAVFKRINLRNTGRSFSPLTAKTFSGSNVSACASCRAFSEIAEENGKQCNQEDGEITMSEMLNNIENREHTENNVTRRRFIATAGRGS